MSSGSSDAFKGQRSLPLPPKRKAQNVNPPVMHQQPMLFPIAPAGDVPQAGSQQNGLVPGCVSSLPFASGQPIHPLGFLNQGLFHPGHSTLGVGSVQSTANANNVTSQVQPFGSPTFFQGWRLRSGKWLEEEETYAELLIDMFDKGLLADCMTGATLRAYLAQKLHCAPMRISKKYAGKCIGKKVYSCRLDMRKNVPPAYAEQRRKQQQRVEEAQKAFHESASADAPEMKSPGAVMPGFVPLMAAAPGMPFGLNPMANAAQQFIPQVAQNNFLAMNQAANFFVSAHQQGMQNIPSVSSAPSLHVPGPATSMSSQVNGGEAQVSICATASTPGSNANVTANVSDLNKQLKDSYSRAAGSQLTSIGSSTIMPEFHAPSNTQMKNERMQMTAATNNLLIPTKDSRASSTLQTEFTGKSDPSLRNPQGVQPDFPDFMAGFDKVALSIKPATTNTTSNLVDQNQLQCSPPFTSRSFDDFHRFLGKDLSPLDEATGADLVQKPTSPSDSLDINNANHKPVADKVVLDTTALFTAESYAMFAQESALAASQHAAYLSQSHNHASTRNFRLGSFDFDGTMKLVSQHVPIAPRPDPVSRLTPCTKDKAKSNVASIFPGRPSSTERYQIEKSLRNSACAANSRLSETAMVSASEPTSSAAESSLRGSSESNGSDNNSTNSDGHFDSVEDSNSSDDGFSMDDTADSRINNKKGRRDESFSSGQYDDCSCDNTPCESLSEDHPEWPSRKSKRRRMSTES